MRKRQKQRKIAGQHTRTKDLLKLPCLDGEVFKAVAKIDDGGAIHLKRALESHEINESVLSTLKLRSHYNSLLFLKNNNFFASEALLIDKALESMLNKIKGLKGFVHDESEDDSD